MLLRVLCLALCILSVLFIQSCSDDNGVEPQGQVKSDLIRLDVVADVGNNTDASDLRIVMTVLDFTSLDWIRVFVAGLSDYQELTSLDIAQLAEESYQSIVVDKSAVELTLGAVCWISMEMTLSKVEVIFWDLPP